MNRMIRRSSFFFLIVILFLSLLPNSVLGASNLNSLMVDAKNKGTVLKWAISIEGSGDGKTRPWKQYNDAKAAYSKAHTQITNTRPHNAQLLLNQLEEDVNIHIIRAMHYIDAITAGEKIIDKKVQLERLIQAGSVNDAFENAYHELSSEIRKQGILLDRVYGQSTRNLIRDQFKYSAEDTLSSVTYTVTVKMKLDELEAAIANNDAGKQEALKAEINSFMPLVEFNFANQLNERYKNMGIGSDDDIPNKVVLTIEEIKQALADESRKKNIPPEVLKGIAITENGRFQQFNPDGTPFISFDGGIGIMQVTLDESDNRYDKERLKYDTRYNIQVGAEILEEKWRYGGVRTPTINQNERSYLENWYFAIMAYNGLSSRNDPNRTTAARTYQEKVYENIRQYTGIDAKLLAKEDLDFHYENGRLLFTRKMNYVIDSRTNSTQLYQVGNMITLSSSGNLRPNPNTSGTPKSLEAGTVVEIVETGLEDANPFNLFSWYKVKVQGTNEVGYIASLNLK